VKKDKEFKYHRYANVKLNLDEQKSAYPERKNNFVCKSSEFPLGKLSRDLTVENSFMKQTNIKSFEEYMEMDNPSRRLNRANNRSSSEKEIPFNSPKSREPIYDTRSHFQPQSPI
jgi:hypothetical protein